MMWFLILLFASWGIWFGCRMSDIDDRRSGWK